MTLDGSGWQPGETVHLFINDDWGSTWSRDADVVADGNGLIHDQFNLPNWFVAVYSVVATGSASGRVMYSFTDSQPQTVAVSSTTQTVCQESTASTGT